MRSDIVFAGKEMVVNKDIQGGPTERQIGTNQLG